MAKENEGKERIFVTDGFNVASKTLANPHIGGRPLDLAESFKVAGGRGVVMANIDVDPDPEANPQTSREILEKIHTETETLLETPTMRDGMRIISKVLNGVDQAVTISMTVRHPREARNVMIVGGSVDVPKLTVLDAITHKLVDEKPDQTSTFMGITYTTWDLHPDRIYMLLGNGISENMTKKELQTVITRAMDDQKTQGTPVSLQEMTDYIALKVRQKMRGGKRPSGRNLNKLFINDVTISSIETPQNLPKVKPEPVQEQNAVLSFIAKLFKGEVLDDVEFTKSISELSSRLSQSLPPDELSKMKDRLATLKPKNESLELLIALLSYNDSDDVSHAMERRGFKPSDIARHLDTSVVWDMVSVMLNHKDEFRTALSIIFAEVPLGAVPKSVRAKLANIPEDLDIEVKPWYENWYLCDMFAGRMQRALRKNGVIFVNGIPIKFLGKPSGVVLDSVSDPQSKETIFEGTIVSPIDTKQRAQIKAAFDRGDTSIQIDGLKLAVMRSWTKSADGKDWKRAKAAFVEYRKNLPKKFPPNIGRASRKAWRENNREDL